MSATSKFTPLSAVTATPLEWLSAPYLLSGKITMLDGDPGCGKSMITVDLAARLSRGEGLPGGGPAGRPRRTLFLNAEDGREDTLVPRLVAAGADLSQIFHFGGGEGGVSEAVLPRDLPAIEAMVVEAEIDLIVIDPIVAFLGPGVAANVDQAVRQVLRQLAALAAWTGVAIVLVRHLTKQLGGRALYRGCGSIGFAGSARTVLLAARGRGSQAPFVLAGVKCNYGSLPPALEYRIGKNDRGISVLEWLGPSDVTADELCRQAGPEPAGQLAASDWLLHALADGPHRAADLLSAAKSLGIGERTLEKAKQQLGVASKLVYVDGGREWQWLPPEPEPDQAELDARFFEMYGDHEHAAKLRKKAAAERAGQRARKGEAETGAGGA